MKNQKSFFISLLILAFLAVGGFYLVKPQQENKVEILEMPTVGEISEISPENIIATPENEKMSEVLTQEPESLKLLAAAKVPQEAKLFLPLSLKDMSKNSLGELLIWKEPGIVECEPWGPGQGYSPCLPGTLELDPPCPMFMDCDGDGYYWFKGEDCDENCVTCYKNSPFTTSEPDGRDQDCDGLVDDLVECTPQYGASKSFGYSSDCQWLPKGQTNFILVNEGEMGEIPTDEIHCQKIFGECTNATGGFGNCTVSKTPGYFVKGSGVTCGGGIWRTDQGDSIFDCGKALRVNSYRGQYGCGGQCEQCYPEDEDPDKVCYQCDVNSSFDFPTDKNGDGIIGGPWGLCHGYSTVSCQQMTGCQKKISAGKYH